MDPPGSFRLKPTIGVTGTKPDLIQAFQLSNIFTGTTTVSRELAAKLKLQLWEIPGKIEITGATQRGTLRRSRLVMKFKNHANKKNKDAWHQIITPVAVWQR